MFSKDEGDNKAEIFVKYLQGNVDGADEYDGYERRGSDKCVEKERDPFN